MSTSRAEPLPSWRPGEAKDAVLDFVRSVTEPGKGFVEPRDRVATFDNDGTLWCEKPLYVQAAFILAKWGAMVAADPTLAARQPYQAVAEGDVAWLQGLADHLPELVAGLSDAFSGITTGAFEQEVIEFFATTSHPRFGLPYNKLGYLPMQELLDHLVANDFRVFICTGGGRDFVRVVSEALYGIDRDHVIGSSAPVAYRDGGIVRLPGVEQPIDDGPGKPVHIWARTGRRPLLAGGNADGDLEMLEHARFAVLVHHDDGDREYAYDEGAERVLDAADRIGITVLSMAKDFGAIF